MRYIKQFILGIMAYWKAAQLIFSSWMWLAFIVPMALGIGFYLGGEALLGSLKNFSFSDIGEDNGKDLLMVGIQSILVYVTVYMNKYTVLGLLSPLLTHLSTRTEYKLTGNTYPLIIKYYIEDIKRAWVIILRNLGLQMLWVGLFLAITAIFSLPDIVYHIFYYLVAFYFYGFSFMDYATERRRLSVRDSVKFTRKHFATAFALGGIYGGLFFIPYAGVVIAPVFGAVAGTVAVHELVDLSQNPYAVRPGDVPAEENEENGENQPNS